jgi:transglutaminase-like putative cysteine protease
MDTTMGRRGRAGAWGAWVLAGVAWVLGGCASSGERGRPAGDIPAAVATPGVLPPARPAGYLPATEVPNLVTSDLEAAIRRHIDATCAANAGLFPIPHEGGELKLKLVRVHTEYLATVGEDLHFACVDLATREGDVYDVDFFMRGTSKDAAVTETMVHKLNGQPYYVWEQGEDERWERRPPDRATPALLGVVHGRDRFEFTYQATVPALAGRGRMWVPIASSDRFQRVTVRTITAPGTSRVVRDAREGNQVLVLDLGTEDAGKVLEIRYECERLEKSAYPDSPAMAARYLGAERLVPDTDEFRTTAVGVTRGKGTDLERARALYDHTMEHIKYMKYGSGWGKGDAVYACDARSGNCTDFHAYFIALCRSVGIPARFAIGASIPSERSSGSMDGYHCWAEFYAEGRWWPVDISEADKYAPLAGYYFGHNPANRFEFSRGRDLEVAPRPAGGPINFLAYPLLEVEMAGGVAEVVRVPTVFSFRRAGVR